MTREDNPKLEAITRVVDSTHTRSKSSNDVAREGHNNATTTAASTSPNSGRPRTMTSTTEIENTITHPGSVKINVTGAFIVESQEPGTPAAVLAANGNNGQSTGGYYETKDIRLPNHTAVVSHIAVDVSFFIFFLVAHSVSLTMAPLSPFCPVSQTLLYTNRAIRLEAP